MAMPDDFCVFVLTHGRADKIYTIETLKRCGYTGKLYVVIDNEDKTADEYRKRYGDKVLMFDKNAVAQTIDEGDNFNDRRAIIYARNACFQIAKDVGCTYFMELDDDYTSLAYRYGDNEHFIHKPIKNIDCVFSIMLAYYKNCSFLSIAMAQGGDFIGGDDGKFARSFRRRKVMNSFICSVGRPFMFSGRINEDVNTYTCAASRGALFMTIPNIMLNQVQTQKSDGGMSDMYKLSGTYIKSFYTVMYQPSSVCVHAMGKVNPRIHHMLSWENTVPQIIDEKHCKRIQEATHAIP